MKGISLNLNIFDDALQKCTKFDTFRYNGLFGGLYYSITSFNKHVDKI